ncbi:MAG: hypothetical protein HZB25_09610 [Candidatus Eisenbacteria bacterium]|nr:hypothetical protein [Candidatus Eisenbacteria bacterium]
MRQLVNGPVPAGEHSVTWDGRDESGRSTSSGLYFYRLIAGGKVLTGTVTSVR